MSLEEFLNLNKHLQQEDNEPDYKTELKKEEKNLRKEFAFEYAVHEGDLWVSFDETPKKITNGLQIKEVKNIEWSFQVTHYINIYKFNVSFDYADEYNNENSYNNTHSMPFFKSQAQREYFDTNESSFCYNDKQGSRDRQKALVVFCKNDAILFDGKNIQNVLAILKEDYYKSGKWSNTTFDLKLAVGWKAIELKQSWEEGIYSKDNIAYSFESLETMKEGMGLEELSDDAFLRLLKNSFQYEFKKYIKTKYVFS